MFYVFRNYLKSWGLFNVINFNTGWQISFISERLICRSIKYITLYWYWIYKLRHLLLSWIIQPLWSRNWAAWTVDNIVIFLKFDTLYFVFAWYHATPYIIYNLTPLIILMLDLKSYYFYFVWAIAELNIVNNESFLVNWICIYELMFLFIKESWSHFFYIFSFSSCNFFLALYQAPFITSLKIWD